MTLEKQLQIFIDLLKKQEGAEDVKEESYDFSKMDKNIFGMTKSSKDIVTQLKKLEKEQINQKKSVDSLKSELLKDDKTDSNDQKELIKILSPLSGSLENLEKQNRLLSDQFINKNKIEAANTNAESFKEEQYRDQQINWQNELLEALQNLEKDGIIANRKNLVEKVEKKGISDNIISGLTGGVAEGITESLIKALASTTVISRVAVSLAGLFSSVFSLPVLTVIIGSLLAAAGLNWAYNHRTRHRDEPGETRGAFFTPPKKYSFLDDQWLSQEEKNRRLEEIGLGKMNATSDAEYDAAIKKFTNERRMNEFVARPFIPIEQMLTEEKSKIDAENYRQQIDAEILRSRGKDSTSAQPAAPWSPVTPAIPNLTPRTPEISSDRNKQAVNAVQREKGGPVTYFDADGKILETREGGDLNWRTNNPGNMQYGDYAKQKGSIGFALESNGQKVAIFPTKEMGLAAYNDLIRSNYTNLTIPDFVEKYVGRGISEDAKKQRIVQMQRAVGAENVSKKIKDMTEAQFNKINRINMMGEGTKEGKIINQNGNTSLPISQNKMDLRSTSPSNNTIASLTNTRNGVIQGAVVNPTPDNKKSEAAPPVAINNFSRNTNYSVTGLSSADSTAGGVFGAAGLRSVYTSTA